MPERDSRQINKYLTGETTKLNDKWFEQKINFKMFFRNKTNKGNSCKCDREKFRKKKGSYPAHKSVDSKSKKHTQLVVEFHK